MGVTPSWRSITLRVDSIARTVARETFGVSALATSAAIAGAIVPALPSASCLVPRETHGSSARCRYPILLASKALRAGRPPVSTTFRDVKYGSEPPRAKVPRACARATGTWGRAAGGATSRSSLRHALAVGERPCACASGRGAVGGRAKGRGAGYGRRNDCRHQRSSRASVACVSRGTCDRAYRSAAVGWPRPAGDPRFAVEPSIEPVRCGGQEEMVESPWNEPCDGQRRRPGSPSSSRAARGASMPSPQAHQPRQGSRW